MLVQEYLKYLPEDITIMIEPFIKRRNKANLPGFNHYQGNIKGVYKNLLESKVMVVSVEIVPNLMRESHLLYHFYIE